MQKKIRLLAWVVAVVLLLGSAAWGQSDLYVIAGGRPVGTKITSVPYIITNPGFYYLTGNLTSTGSGDAITVNADCVTIDLMGFSITGPGTGNGVGVHMTNKSQVTIRNGALINAFGYGILEDGTGWAHTVANLRAGGNSKDGIHLLGSRHRVTGCTAGENGGTGIYVGSGLITDCVAEANTAAGIQLYGPGVVRSCVVDNSTSSFNLILGNGGATSILVDGNAAYGASPNYTNNASPTSGVVITSNNAGTP